MGEKLQISTNTLKGIFDYSWKIIPLLWVLFQWYSNQDYTAKKVAAQDTRIQTLETTVNQLDRRSVEDKAEIAALKEALANDRQFYLEITRRK